MLVVISCVSFCFFKQKTAYEMRISDWSSDVCSSDLRRGRRLARSPSYSPGSAELPGVAHAPGQHPLGLIEDAPRRRHTPVCLLLGPRSAPEIGRASCRERVCQYV